MPTRQKKQSRYAREQDFFLSGEGDRGGPRGPSKKPAVTKKKTLSDGRETRPQQSSDFDIPTPRTSGKPGTTPAPTAKTASKPPAAPPKGPTISPRGQQDVGRSRATSTPKKDTFTPAHKTIAKGVKKGGGKLVESVKKSPTIGLAKKAGAKYTADTKKELERGKKAGATYTEQKKRNWQSLLAGLKAAGAEYKRHDGGDEGDKQAMRAKQTAAQLKRMLKEKEEEARKSRERRMGSRI